MLTGRDFRPIFQGKATSIKVAGSSLKRKRLLTDRDCRLRP